MQTAFLIIIALIGSIYALVTRQTKTALGLFVILIALILQIPGLASGFWVNLLLALSLMVFTVGVGVIVWKKKEIEPETPEPIIEKDHKDDTDKK